MSPGFCQTHPIIVANRWAMDKGLSFQQKILTFYLAVIYDRRKQVGNTEEYATSANNILKVVEGCHDVTWLCYSIIVCMSPSFQGLRNQ